MKERISFVVLTCDRCGVRQEIELNERGQYDKSELQWVRIEAKDSHIDLCPLCYEEFEQWLKISPTNDTTQN